MQPQESEGNEQPLSEFGHEYQPQQVASFAPVEVIQESVTDDEVVEAPQDLEEIQINLPVPTVSPIQYQSNP